MSLPKGVVCKSYKGTLPKGEGLAVGKRPSVPQSLSVVVTFQWTSHNQRMPFFMVGILLELLENRNTCASRLYIVTSNFAQTTINP